MSAAQQLVLGLVADPIAAPTDERTEAGEEPCIGDWIMEALERQAQLAEQQERELRELLAKLEGVPVDQLDAHLAEKEAREKAELDAELARIDEERAARGEAPISRPGKRAKRRAAAAKEEATVSQRIGASALTERQRELLTYVRVESNVAVFARDERIPDWNELKRVMVALGGKWRARKGFVFADDVDAQELVRLALETGEILDPKAADFFETPCALADRVVAHADIRPGDRVLEPSAGRGAIALAVRRACVDAQVLCVEPLPNNRAALEREGFDLIGEDFLALDPETVGLFDAIPMNPPFSKRADIVHVEHALRFLRPGGALVSIMSAGALHRDDKKGVAFRKLVTSHGGYFEQNPNGSFLASGTGVSTVTLVIPRSR